MLHREWHHQKWWSREAQDCSTEATIKLAETVRVNFWNCNLMKKASMGSTLWRKSPLNSGKMILVSARSACEDSGPLFGAAWWCQRGAVQTLYSQNCGCVCGPVWQFPDGLIQRFAFALPPLNSWALKTWPTREGRYVGERLWRTRETRVPRRPCTCPEPESQKGLGGLHLWMIFGRHVCWRWRLSSVGGALARQWHTPPQSLPGRENVLFLWLEAFKGIQYSVFFAVFPFPQHTSLALSSFSFYTIMCCMIISQLIYLLCCWAFWVVGINEDNLKMRPNRLFTQSLL